MFMRLISFRLCFSAQRTSFRILSGFASYSVITSERTSLMSGKSNLNAILPVWRKDQENYTPHKLSSSRVQKVAQLSNTKEFRELLQPILIPRVPGSAGNAKVRKYISESLMSLGFTVETDSFIGFPPAPFTATNFTNIVATSDPAAPRRLVMACHYDSKILSGAEFIGATDSAVSCALLLDIANCLYHLLKNRKKSDIALQLMFFDGEEAFVEWSDTDSCYGSHQLARKLSNQHHPASPQFSDLAGIDLFILLDLIGASDMMFHNFFPKTTKSFERLASIEEELRRTNVLKSARNEPYFSTRSIPDFIRFCDDHQSFEERGVPVMHLIAYPFPSVWHTPLDNAEHLDFDGISEINAVLRVFVCEYLNCQI